MRPRRTPASPTMMTGMVTAFLMVLLVGSSLAEEDDENTGETRQQIGQSPDLEALKL